MLNRITLSSQPLFEETLSPFIYGDFIEFVNDLIPGMWAEKVQDRSFEGVLQPNYVWPPGQSWVYPRWQPFVAGQPARDHWPDQPRELEMVTAAVDFQLDHQEPFVGRHSARVHVDPGDGRPFVAGIAQEGIAVRGRQKLELELYLRAQYAGAGPVRVLLGRSYGVFFHAYDELELSGVTQEWQRFTGTLTPRIFDENATLAIGLSGAGTFWVDKVSLMPADNRHGWRADVVEAVLAMKPGMLRFGGSSLIYYAWENGIGPRERRVPFENQPWGNREENDVGLHEFLQFCELVGAEPLVCLNANSATLEQLLSEIEYCNGPAASPYGRVRAERGHPEPFGVRYWQIGNEQSGEAYEQTLTDTARAIRKRYPELILLASYPSDAILRSLSDQIDYICPHFYAPYTAAGEAKLRGLIEQIGREAKNKNLKLGITEWNHTASHWGWGRAWLLTLYNALNAARMFNLLHRLGDRIRIANRSNLVNSCCSGCIQTRGDDLYFTPCYYVQKAYANFAGEQVLKLQTDPSVTLDLSATRRLADGAVALFVVNFGAEAQYCEIDVSRLEGLGNHLDIWTLAGSSLDAVNSFHLQEKKRVAPWEEETDLPGPVFSHQFPGYSVTVMRFSGSADVKR